MAPPEIRDASPSDNNMWVGLPYSDTSAGAASSVGTTTTTAPSQDPPAPPTETTKITIPAAPPASPPPETGGEMAPPETRDAQPPDMAIRLPDNYGSAGAPSSIGTTTTVLRGVGAERSPGADRAISESDQGPGDVG